MTAAQLTPMTSRYPMSWPPTGCNWCYSPEVTWAFPMGQVTFWRRLPDGGIQEIEHHAQPWFACGRCQEFIHSKQYDELAAELGRPPGYFDRLRAARLASSGYAWSLDFPSSRARP